MLDPEPLLAPIPGPSPAGRRLSPLDGRKLKDLREDIDPEREKEAAEGISDPAARAAELARIGTLKRKRPQWAEVVAFGTDYLATKGKDLDAAVAVVEGATVLDGFAGLRDGLRLVRRLCEECWDRMHPEIDDPDDPDAVEARTRRLGVLGDDRTPPFFPNTVRAVPLLRPADGPAITAAACLPRPGFRGTEPPEVSHEAFLAAVATAPAWELDAVRAAAADLASAREEVAVLDRVLEAKAGKMAPSLAGLRKAIEDCEFRLAAILGPPAETPAAEPPAAESPAGAPTPTPDAAAVAPAGPAIRSREDVYLRLAELLELLERYDPHSPVPFLIRRAIEMRGMRFPELVDALTRDAGVMSFLRTPLGGAEGAG
jgi:type VI secretion system protein ImpA